MVSLGSPALLGGYLGARFAPLPFINYLLLHDVIIGKADELYVSRHGKEKKKDQNVLLKNYWLEPR